MKWTEENIEKAIMDIANQYDPPKMPTNKEAIELTGDYSLSGAIQKNGGYDYWAKRLGLKQGKSETRMGIEWEKKIAKVLESKGHNVEMTSVKHPYDLLVDSCVKVDVKTANVSKIRGCDVYSYRIAKPQHTCDFYVCCENDGLKDIYVIPANMVSGQTQIEMGVRSAKYSHYRNAYYLIEEASQFFRSLVSPF